MLEEPGETLELRRPVRGLTAQRQEGQLLPNQAPYCPSPSSSSRGGANGGATGET